MERRRKAWGGISKKHLKGDYFFLKNIDFTVKCDEFYFKAMVF